MFHSQIPSWKKAPFIRLLIPFVTGILLQWHFDISLFTLVTFLCATLFCLLFTLLLKTKWLFKYGWLSGLLINMMLMCGGGTTSYFKNGQHQPKWVGYHYQNNNSVAVTLLEPLSEKSKSYKAVADVYAVNKNHEWKAVNGNIIIYFKKDSTVTDLQYGSQLIISRPLQPIQNSGNPGAFNYQRYCAFNNIYYQVFLNKGDYKLLGSVQINPFKKFLFNIQQWVVEVLEKNISGKKEVGLAEALLIGYKDDLDKTLVQSYTNTGVVHIIAISGLHLGLIYWLLTLLCKPLQKIRWGKWLKPVIIIAGLWLFSLLAGGSASVLRSAVMFTCLVIGEMGEKRSSILNSLAASAFLLLCYNPYWLWDVGFQLSYAAVLSLIIFMQPVYRLLTINNKLLDMFWKLSAVTIAAQILTVPLSVYHFHQFPVYFLITNIVAVPLSSLIVLGEVLLCTISFVQPIAAFAGKIISLLIYCMNAFIEWMERMPFSLWDNLFISLPQLLSLLVFIACISFWLMEKKASYFITALFVLLCFVVVQTVNINHAKKQYEVIVYNVPQHQAIDIISGEEATFIGDSILLENDFLQNFHLRPARIMQRAAVKEYAVHQSNALVQLDKNILLVDGLSSMPKQLNAADVLILSHLQKKTNFQKLLGNFSPKIIVADGTISGYKLHQLQDFCMAQKLPLHAVQQQGAFIFNLKR